MVRRLFVAALICLLTQCKNPFLPPIGEPVQFPASGKRSTPQGLIDQLIESYESQRIDLFKDLFPTDGSFQFFIAPSFFAENPAKYQELSEPRDVRLRFIGESEYYFYWTQAAEVERHTRLFSRVTSIEFDSKPILGTVRSFVDSGDSLAELLLTGGQFNIYIATADKIEKYPVAIDKQVFLIQKDPEGLWVIRKWYDFSTGE